MLTVKWSYWRDGVQIEHVYECERVTAAWRNAPPAPKGPDGCGYEERPLQIWGRDLDQAICILDGQDYGGPSFNGGQVYVMNEHGKTVAKYDLGVVAPVLDDAPHLTQAPHPTDAPQRAA